MNDYGPSRQVLLSTNHDDVGPYLPHLLPDVSLTQAISPQIQPSLTRLKFRNQPNTPLISCMPNALSPRGRKKRGGGLFGHVHDSLRCAQALFVRETVDADPMKSFHLDAKSRCHKAIHRPTRVAIASYFCIILISKSSSVAASCYQHRAEFMYGMRLRSSRQR